MRLLLVITVLSATFSLASFAFWVSTPPPVSPVTPSHRKGVHLEDSVRQFGVVGLNAEVRGSFTVVNDTDGPVALGEPQKSCSCTAAEVGQRELAPGERCSLSFAIQTGSRRGPRAEAIGLLYAPAGGELRQLFARVYFVPKGVFELEPGEVVLTRAQPKASFVVRGDPTAGQSQVLDARSNHRCVKVDASALPVVILELDLETTDESILNTECVVYTNNPAESTITVPVRVRK